jgi:hypothetical protein
MILGAPSSSANGAAVLARSGIWDGYLAVPPRRSLQGFEGIERTSELDELFRHVETQLGFISGLPILAAPFKILPDRESARLAPVLYWPEVLGETNGQPGVRPR